MSALADLAGCLIEMRGPVPYEDHKRGYYLEMVVDSSKIPSRYESKEKPAYYELARALSTSLGIKFHPRIDAEEGYLISADGPLDKLRDAMRHINETQGKWQTLMSDLRRLSIGRPYSLAD